LRLPLLPGINCLPKPLLGHAMCQIGSIPSVAPNQRFGVIDYHSQGVSFCQLLQSEIL
jgi:hypothetical protein